MGRRGWGLLARAAALAVVGTYAGTVWTVRDWAVCPLGNDAGAGFGLTFGTAPRVFVVMTFLLVVVQIGLRALVLPFRAVSAVQWLVPVAAGVALTVLYRVGMQWPAHLPDGSCFEGYPSMPFGTKPHAN